MSAAHDMSETEYELQLELDIAGFTHDPLGFVKYAFPWGEGELANEPGPYAWQAELLTEIGDMLKTGAGREDALAHCFAVASGHGIGKSAMVAMIVLWAMSTMEDTRGVVTANTERQLTTKTWPEVKKWHRRSINAHWFECTATALFSTEPERDKNWRFDATPWTEHNSEAFAGLHNKGKRLVLIMDEASAIVDKIWEVAEGALTDELTEILWLAFGNGTRATGRFRECFRGHRHRWRGRNIDSRTVEGTNKAQLDKFVEDNGGEDSDIVKVRVRGLFPAQSFKQFISETDVDHAFGKHLKETAYNWAPKIISVDPAWDGGDELVIGMRQGLAFSILRTLPKNDNDMEVGALVASLQDEHRADAVFVDGGYGTGILSFGKTLKRDWRIVWFSGASSDEGCLNKRAEMWKLTRDWLKEGGAIPADNVLRQDLTGPETVARVDGKIQLESKESMKLRGLPSPNRGDALAITFAYPVAPKTEDERALMQAATQAVTDYNPLGDG